MKFDVVEGFLHLFQSQPQAFQAFPAPYSCGQQCWAVIQLQFSMLNCNYITVTDGSNPALM